jgi:hypothetical protein
MSEMFAASCVLCGNGILAGEIRIEDDEKWHEACAPSYPRQAVVAERDSLRAALKIATDVLVQIKSALGDRLLARGPLSLEYAHAVMRDTDDALSAIAAAIGEPK